MSDEPELVLIWNAYFEKRVPPDSVRPLGPLRCDWCVAARGGWSWCFATAEQFLVVHYGDDSEDRMVCARHGERLIALHKERGDDISVYPSPHLEREVTS